MKIVSRKKLKQRLKWYAINYCETTSLHAFHYIGNKSRFKSTFWILICLLSLSFMIYFIYLQWHFYDTHRVSTSISTTMHSIWNVPFPKITVCNSNLVHKNGYKKFEKMLMEYNISRPQIWDYFANLSSLVITSELGNHADWVEIRKVEAIFKAKGYDLDRVMYEVSQPCDELISNCKVKDEPTNCKTAFQLTKSTSGYCCTTTYNNQYTGVGPHYGFQFDVDVEINESISSLQPYYGVEVSIGTSEYPDTLYNGVPVSMQNEVHFIITPQVIKATESLFEMDLSVRKCIFTSERKKIWNFTYSFSTCMESCRANAFLEHCGCIPFYYPSRKVRVCGLVDLHCLLNTTDFTETARYYLRQDELKTLNKSSDVLYCECPLQCETVETRFVTRSRHVEKKISGFDEVIKGSRIYVYYNDEHCVLLMKSPYYTWDSFLAAIGGIFGLCLGGSFLSIIELIYFLLNAAFSKFKGNLLKPVLVKQQPKIELAYKPRLYVTDFKIKY